MSELKGAAHGAHFIEEFKRALLFEGGYVTSLTAEVINHHTMQKDVEKEDRDTKNLPRRVRRRTSARAQATSRTCNSTLDHQDFEIPPCSNRRHRTPTNPHCHLEWAPGGQPG